MRKNLAIKGHSTRGEEVIELLKMLGGVNDEGHIGTNTWKDEYYSLDSGYIRAYDWCDDIKFTLEEFWEKYPYKLNDLVLCDDGLLGVVTKMEWDCEKSDMKYHISFKMPVDNKWYSSKNIKCKFMEAKSKKLAILGHKTRGHEVIELLKIMGGKICAFDYDSDGYAYYIDTSNMIICSNENTIKQNLDKYQLFTLEEFWEKYPFKIGDKVIDEADGCPGVVCEMKWDEGLSDMKYCVAFGNGIDFGWFANDSINFFKIKKNENLEETQSNQDIDKVVDIFRKEFCECCGSQRCSGQDDELVYCERFKNLMDNSGKPSVENHKMGPKSKLPSKYYEDRLEETQTKRDIDKAEFMIKHMILPNKMDDRLEYEIINGYEFDKVENNKIILKPIKSKYPKTYAECCDVLLIPPYYNLRYHTYERGYNEYATSNTLLSLQDKLNTLGKLIICRDAYWKMAGEEMGLGKPWEPDWGDFQTKYGISYYNCTLSLNEYVNSNKILAFPTEEMRDAFYENFKDLIVQCKKLL